MCLGPHVANLNISLEPKPLEKRSGSAQDYYRGTLTVCEFIHWNDRRKARVFYKNPVPWRN